MPTYVYACDACGHRFERFQSIKDKAVRLCPKCQKRKVQRVITAGAGVIFKGSGFYATDYRPKRPAEKAPDSSKEKSGTLPCGEKTCKQPEVCSPDKK